MHNSGATTGGQRPEHHELECEEHYMAWQNPQRTGEVTEMDALPRPAVWRPFFLVIPGNPGFCGTTTKVESLKRPKMAN